MLRNSKRGGGGAKEGNKSCSENNLFTDGKLTHSIVLRHRLSAKVGHESPRKAGREGVPGRGGGKRERKEGLPP